MAEGEFSVCHFFENDSYIYEVRFVDAETAVKTALNFTQSSRPSVIMGITKRVIITDRDDCTNWEWINGKGVVFPPPKPKDV